MFSYFIIILILPLSLLADEKLRLIRADILENDIVNGQSIQFLYGNVIFELPKSPGSFEFSYHNSIITLEIEKQQIENCIRISVIDHGIGISDENKEDNENKKY